MEIKFNTLTPIFTGDANTNQGRLRESGLIGSLRFWGGTLFRGLGYKVLSATQDHPEIQSIEEIKDLDPITRLFGSTGWKRNFKLTIDHPEPHNFGTKILQIQSSSPRKGWFLKPGFFLPWESKVTLDIKFSHKIEELMEELITNLSAIWVIIDRLGGITAHQGWGYGQIRIENNLSDILNNFSIKYNTEKNSSGLPDMADFFFAEYEFPTIRELKPLRNNQALIPNPKDWKWPAATAIPALLTQPVGLVLRYLLQNKDTRYKSKIAEWGLGFFGGAGKFANGTSHPAGNFHGSFFYRVGDTGQPEVNGKKIRFRIWAWLPKSIFNEKAKTLGRFDWFEAATLLREELCQEALWGAVANCSPPKECYFWPLTSATTNPELKSISKLLTPIEERAVKVLNRNGLENKGGPLCQ